MNIKIVKSEVVNKTSKAGKQYQIQRLLVEFGDERQWLEYFHGQDSEKYEIGIYQLSPESLMIVNKKLVISDFPTFNKVQAARVA